MSGQGETIQYLSLIAGHMKSSAVGEDELGAYLGATAMPQHHITGEHRAKRTLSFGEPSPGPVRSLVRVCSQEGKIRWSVAGGAPLLSCDHNRERSCIQL